MKQFNGNRKLEDILKIMKSKKWKVNMKQFNAGGDWIYFDKFIYDGTLFGANRIAFSSFGGRFMWYLQDAPDVDFKRIATERSEELDNTDWYVEMLENFYLPASV